MSLSTVAIKSYIMCKYKGISPGFPEVYSGRQSQPVTYTILEPADQIGDCRGLLHFFLFYFIVCCCFAYVYVCGRMLDPSEPEFQTMVNSHVWVLGIKPGSLEKQPL